jgi:hypothetical protein
VSEKPSQFLISYSRLLGEFNKRLRILQYASVSCKRVVYIISNISALRGPEGLHIACVETPHTANTVYSMTYYSDSFAIAIISNYLADVPSCSYSIVQRLIRMQNYMSLPRFILHAKQPDRMLNGACTVSILV